MDLNRKKLVYLESTRQDGSNDTHIAWVDSKIKIQKFEILAKKGQKKAKITKANFGAVYTIWVSLEPSRPVDSKNTRFFRFRSIFEVQGQKRPNCFWPFWPFLKKRSVAFFLTLQNVIRGSMGEHFRRNLPSYSTS